MAAREAAAGATATEKTSASTRSATATVDEETAAPHRAEDQHAQEHQDTRRRRPQEDRRGCRPGRRRPAPSGDRRVPRQGQEDRRLPGLRLHRGVEPAATSATCRAAPPTCPPSTRASRWARLGVDVDNEFEPLYIVTPDKKSTVTELKDALKEVDELYLATDDDREGEAIAWHLLETLKPKVPVRRMVFHEITESAIQAAAANPRELDQDLVDAQETRRILDRLYGYEVSPVLWKKVMPKLSAGRVQSVATRVIVQRERERMAFVSASYWGIAAIAATPARPRAPATRPRSGRGSSTIDGARVATGRDFDAARAAQGPTRSAGSTRPTPAAWSRRWRAASTRSPRSRTSRTPASPTRRS